MAEPSTTRITLATALLRYLRAQHVEVDGKSVPLFGGLMGIFGHGNVSGLGAALEEEGETGLPFLQPKNEQAMVHAAIAYAKARRRLGIMACTSSVGPGATNMVTGAATATINRLPVLLLPGDVFASRRPHPVLQQLECAQAMDISVNDCFRPVSRFFDRISRPEQVLASLPEAVRVLLDPAETGAVTLCLPEDAQTEAFDCPLSFLQPHTWRVERRPPSADRIADAAFLVRHAERPLIIAGGGVHASDATQALRTFVDATGIPVATTQAGMGALTAEHPLWLGGIGVTGSAAANEMARDADLVLAVGTRFSDFTTASKTLFQAERVRFVHINVNAADAHKQGAMAVVGDACLSLDALHAALGGHRVSSRHAERVNVVRRQWLQTRNELGVRSDGMLSQADVIRVLNEHVTEMSTVVHAAGGLPGDMHKLWLSRSANDVHSEYGYSCMGYEIAGALGVKMAQPDREVFALLGDGSYLMLHSELLTAVQERLKLVVLLVDNHGYQCIHHLQRSVGGRSFGNEFRHRQGARLEGDVVEVDFVSNARSLGADGIRVETRSELVDALAQARRSERSVLIHVVLQGVEALPGTAWWDVPVLEASQRPEVRKARGDYEEARARQRFFGASSEPALPAQRRHGDA